MSVAYEVSGPDAGDYASLCHACQRESLNRREAFASRRSESSNGSHPSTVRGHLLVYQSHFELWLRLGHLLLALTSICAIAAFPLSQFLTIIPLPNKARYVKPLILWAALSLLLALAVLCSAWLIWFGAFYLIALSLNIALAPQMLERSLATMT